MRADSEEDFDDKVNRNLEAVLEYFPIDISSTEIIWIKGLRPDTKIFKVDSLKSELLSLYCELEGKEPNIGESYIIDTISGRDIACHPHIVGEELEKKSLDSAKEFVRAAYGLGLIGDYDSDLESDKLAILHILRGARGYMVADAFADVFKQKPPIINIRTQYRSDSYRAHGGEKRPDIIYRDYSVIKTSDASDISTVIIPDTFATGMSAKVPILDLLEHGIRPERIILYGFTSMDALAMLGMLAYDNDIELISFAKVAVSKLARNGYDMPIYGPDESLYSEAGEVKHLASIIDKATLRGCLDRYVAGSDMPGDFSQRPSWLFDGHNVIDGTQNIIGHLGKSIKLVESLDRINRTQPWYSDFHRRIAERELGELQRTLEVYSRKLNFMKF